MTVYDLIIGVISNKLFKHFYNATSCCHCAIKLVCAQKDGKRPKKLVIEFFREYNDCHELSNIFSVGDN